MKVWSGVKVSERTNLEGDDPFGRAAHVGHDEADAGIKLTRMPLDLGDHPARLGPASCLIGKVRVVSPDFVWRPTDRTLEQIADPVLKNLVGGQPDRILDPLRKPTPTHDQYLAPTAVEVDQSPLRGSWKRPAPTCALCDR